MGLKLGERVPTYDGSVTLDAVDDQTLEEKVEDEGIEIGPVLPTPDGDDYPDGGLAAWCVVLGVSSLAISSESLGVY